MEDYKEIKEMLKPRRDIKASEELRHKVNSALERSGRKQAIREWTFGGIGLSAVAAILIFVLIPSGMSAKEILAEAIKAIRGTEYIEMTVDIRTRPVENFGYIGINEDFVAHNIVLTKVMDNPEKIKPDALRPDIAGISLKKFQNGIIHKILGLKMVAKSIIRKTDKIVEIILDYSADSFVPYLLKHTVSVLMLLPNKTKSRRNRRDLGVKNIATSPH